MPCFHPVQGYRLAGGGFTQSAAASLGRVPLTVPCGRCIGCRVSRSRDWTTRLHHEASLHDVSSFLTLTFSDENLPPSYSVDVRDIQLFMKRLRKRLRVPVRFFACGEYGERNYRPHYHLILFGYDFPDRQLWRKTGSGHVTYRSPELDQVWTFGHAEVGTVTPQSAGYVARYVLKKVTGEAAVEYYRRVHPLTGEVVNVAPEFICMSNKPGIGAGWYDRYSMDAFPSDFVIVDGQKRPVPRYYKKKLEEEASNAITDKRKKEARKRVADNTPERRAVREEVLTLRLDQLKRELDEEQ